MLFTFLFMQFGIMPPSAPEFWKKVSDAFPLFKENILREAAADTGNGL